MQLRQDTRESVTEQLFTRIGQTIGVDIAESQLMFIGGQVRFLSRFFLRRGKESLMHGLEIFREHLDEHIVKEIAEQRVERDFYTFQTVCAAIEDNFPEHHMYIISAFVEMLAFDALAGNNDRHPGNWGVIVPTSRDQSPRFSPIYDSARGLFWNHEEKRVRSALENRARLESYVEQSRPLISWDDRNDINHFELIRLINLYYPRFRPSLEKFVSPVYLSNVSQMIENEFRHTMSVERRKLIVECLRVRYQKYLYSLAG